MIVPGVQADELKLQDLRLQALKQRIIARMIKQFVVDPQRLLQIALFLIAFSLPRPSVQSTQLTAVALMHFLKFIGGLRQKLLELGR